jgi:hypothetical protein
MRSDVWAGVIRRRSQNLISLIIESARIKGLGVMGSAVVHRDVACTAT